MDEEIQSPPRSFSPLCHHSSRTPMKMANSENSVAQTILYLRPQCGGIAVLDILDNEPYVFKVAPSPEPVDIPLEGIPNLSPTARLSPCTALHDYDRTSRESTPGPYSACQRVLRLGFDTTEEPSAVPAMRKRDCWLFKRADPTRISA